MKFLFAWELGGGLGHLMPLAQIARPLLASGHEVHFVLRDLSAVRTAFGDVHDHPRARLWQAPVWHPQFRSARHPVAYPELLFVGGYLDAPRLVSLAKAWCALFESIAPDLLLADHAPTALLAARAFAFPRVLTGNGYMVPPDCEPIPAFAEWERVDAARLVATERTVLDACNVVLRALDRPPLGALRELNATDERFLFTWPELDAYSAAVRGPGTRYDGVLPPRSGGAPPHWPDGDGRRLFAYLRHESPQTVAILRQLALGPWRAFAYVSGIPAPEAAAIQSPYLTIATTPADLGAAGQSADALLCHGNFNTVCQMLSAGVPVVVLPTDAEKLLTGRRVAQMGAGFVLAGDRVAEDLPGALERLATESSFRDAARAFSARVGAYGEDVAARAAARCEALAAARVAAPIDTR